MPDVKSYVTDLPDGSKEIDFSAFPLKIDGTEIKKLVMREPTVDDQLSVDGITSAARKEVQVIANLCEQAPEAISGLKMRQYGRLQDVYADFMA